MCYTGPTLKFFKFVLLGLKFGMVRLDTPIDIVGGFPYSNMTNTNNSSIKNHTNKLINVLHRANIDFF